MARSNIPHKPSTVGDLTTPERQKYLTAIDRLRELGLNEEISLPQLVVVGDQSSGKSSLLEGVTGFGFPIASDLCTRFSTQIVMRRTAEPSAFISIIPGPSSRQDEAVQELYRTFKQPLTKDDFETDAFRQLLATASSLMGLPSTLEESAEPSAKRFSDDVLKIEINGPDQDNLSVVDVPGLFHNPTKYQTETDRAIIRNMINEYMQDQRTIILAVMDARNNLANQEVFEMARHADQEGTRTVAVITKCDALQSGDEETVLRIARNEVERLRYGWFVVRNRSTKDISEGVTIAQRHENERLFLGTSPWNQLDSDRRGVPALKKFLGQLLYDHIRREFPQVVKEVESRFEQVNQELNGLGAPRQTAHQQRQFLTKLASSYSRLVQDSLKGNYDPSLEADHPLKFRMRLRKVDDAFEEALRKRGHAKVFRTVDDAPDPDYRRKTDDNIYDWIRIQYQDSRGSELPGTVNPTLLENLFRQLTTPWEKIAMKYLENAAEVIRDFNEQCHLKLVSDSRLRENLLAWHVTTASKTFEEAAGRLTELLRDERGGILQTLNHYYADTLHSIRQDRVLARLKKLDMNNGFSIDMNAVLNAAHLTNEEQAVNDIHDILKAYYKVAHKRFLDSVLLTVRERSLVGEHSSLRTFTPDYISEFGTEKLSALAEENFALTQQRERVTQRFEMLSQALDIVKNV